MDVTSSEHNFRCFESCGILYTFNWTSFCWLVNNAGVGYVDPVEFLNMDRAHWLFDVNYFGLIEKTKESIPLLIAHQGRIVNIGSVAG